MSDNTVPTWEESMPATENTVPTWEESSPVAERPRFAAPRSEWTGDAADPLSFAPVQQRMNFETLARNSKDPDDTRKRIALSYFFANEFKVAPAFAYSNIESFVRNFYGGIETTVPEAYDHLANADSVGENLKKTGRVVVGMGESLLRGLYRVGVNAGAFLEQAALTTDPDYAIAKGLQPEEKRREIEQGEKAYLERVKDDTTKINQRLIQEQRDMLEDINRDAHTDTQRFINGFFVETMPALAAFVLESAAVTPAGAIALGAVDQHTATKAELEMDHPEMSDADTGTVAAVSTGISVLTQLATMKLARIAQNKIMPVRTLAAFDKEGGAVVAQQLGDAAAKVGAIPGATPGALPAGAQVFDIGDKTVVAHVTQAVDKSVLAYMKLWGVNVGGGAALGALEKLVNNAVEIGAGIRPEELRYEGVMKQSLLRGGWGAFFSAENMYRLSKYPSVQSLRADTMRDWFEVKTPAEAWQLARAAQLGARETLRLAEGGPAASGTPAATGNAPVAPKTPSSGEIARARIVADAADKYAAARVTTLSPVPSHAETASKEDLQQRLEHAAAEAAERVRLRREVPHDRDTSRARIKEVAKLYPGVPIEAVDEWSPEQIAVMEARGIDFPEHQPAFYDYATGKAYFNVSNFGESEADALVFHECAMHGGLDRLLGDRAPAFYDAVYRDFAKDPVMREIIDEYDLAPRDEEGVPQPENMTDAQKREATEEFVRKVGEEANKPEAARAPWYSRAISWLKRLLQKFLPDLHFTRTDLENTARAAARAARRPARHGGRGEGVRLAVVKNIERAATEYGPENQKIFELASLAKGARGKKQAFRFLSDVTEKEAADIKNATGAEVSGFVHIIDEDVIRKLDNLRGNIGFEKSKGVTIPSEKELSLLPVIIHEYDSIDPIAIHDNSNVQTIQYTKRIGDIFYVVEEIRTGRKRLAVRRFTKRVPPMPDVPDKSVPGRTSETIGGDIDNINASGEKSSGAGQAGQAEDIRKTDVSETDVSDQIGTDSENPFRHALSADDRDIVQMVRAKVGREDFNGAEILEYLHDNGVDCTPEQAEKYARRALLENRAAVQHAARLKKLDWIYEHIPLYRHAVDFGRERNFTIKPSAMYIGEEYSGTFIDPMIVKYSHKRKRSEFKSDREYSRYLARREAALKNASGIDSDALAKYIVEKQGGDWKAVEQELLEFFNGLTKPKLYERYTTHHREMEQHMLDEEIAADAALYEAIMTGREKLTPGMLARHPRIEKKLREELQLEHVNREQLAAAFQHADYKVARGDADNRKLFVEAYLDALETELDELRSNVNAEAADLQRRAAKFASEHLEPGIRGEFTRAIVNLLKKPRGEKRERAFEELLDAMARRAGEARKDRDIAKIRDLLDRNRTKRTRKNEPFSPLGEKQPVVDRIAQIVRMDPETVAGVARYSLAAQSELAEAIEALPDEVTATDEKAENSREELRARLDKLEKDAALLDTFGALSLKTPEAVREAREKLHALVKEGRDEFVTRKAADAEYFEDQRQQVRMELTHSAQVPNVPSERELDRTVNRVSDYFYKNESITRLLDYLSGTSNLIDLENSAAGQRLREIDDSTGDEQTLLNARQIWFDETLKKLGVVKIAEKGRIINGAMREEETPVKLVEYGSRVGSEDDGNAHIDWSKGRPQRRESMNLEHARKMLEDINGGMKIRGVIPLRSVEEAKTARQILKDNGVDFDSRYFSLARLESGELRLYHENEADETVGRTIEAIPDLINSLQADESEIELSEITIHGAKEQIFDHDSGASPEARNVFGDDIDQEAWNAFLASQSSGARKILLIAPDAAREASRETPLTLSPGAAMQLILTWEQPHYQPGMRWNGYSEKTIDDLKKWLDSKNPAYLQFAYAMRDFIKAHNSELDAAVFDRYGVHLPENDNFFYADFSGNVAQEVRNPGYGNPAGGMTVNASFLTGRRFHLLAPSTHTNAITLFLCKQMEQDHFIAWSQTIRTLRAVYGDRAVQNTLIKNYGQAAWNNLKEKIEMLAANGREAEGAARVLDFFFRGWTPSNIALNPASLSKQMAAGLSYAHYVPLPELLNRLPEANSFNPEYRRWLAIVLQHDPYLANRAAGGLDPNLAGLLNSSRRGDRVHPVNEAITKETLKGTFVGDRWSTTHFGYAAFRYFYDYAVENGYPETLQDNALIIAAADKLAGAPVASVEANVIRQGNGLTAMEAAKKYIRENIADTYPTAAGEVVVDERGAHTSLSHSMYQNKLDALQAIPEVLTRGAYLGAEQDLSGKPINNHYFAAKVRIGGKDKIVFVRVRHPEGGLNRFYVHEVFTLEEIKTAATPPGQRIQTAHPDGNPADLYRNILRNVLNVKRETAFDFALRMWKRATDETQQSGQLKDRNYFTAAPGLGRALVTYQTGPMQVNAQELTWWQKLLHRFTRENAKGLANSLLINRLNALAMNLITSFFLHGFDFKSYLDDWDDYVAGLLFGNLGALWMFGKIGVGLLNGSADTDILPVAKDMSQNLRRVRKNVGKFFDKGEVDPWSILDMAEATGNAMMFVPKTRGVGIALRAASKQTRRAKRMFWPEEKKTRRRKRVKI